MSAHARIAAITNRIVERSKPTRERYLERLRAAGLPSVLVVDLGCERWGIPVVRVIVPGAEGPDDEPTYVPGRRARAAMRTGVQP